jgi:hypothetical protein
MRPLGVRRAAGNASRSDGTLIRSLSESSHSAAPGALASARARSIPSRPIAPQSRTRGSDHTAGIWSGQAAVISCLAAPGPETRARALAESWSDPRRLRTTRIFISVAHEPQGPVSHLERWRIPNRVSVVASNATVISTVPGYAFTDVSREDVTPGGLWDSLTRTTGRPRNRLSPSMDWPSGA